MSPAFKSKSVPDYISSQQQILLLLKSTTSFLREANEMYLKRQIIYNLPKSKK